jgi:hypothetical protein
MNLKKVLLVFSFFTICIIALLYGVSPSWFFSTFLVDSQAPSIDQSHILRAVMMLYIPYSGTFFEKSLNYKASHDLVKICSRRIKWC